MNLCGKRGRGKQHNLVLILQDSRCFHPTFQHLPPDLLVCGATSGLGEDSKDKSRTCCRSLSSVDWRKHKALFLCPLQQTNSQHDEMEKMKLKE